MAHSRTRQSEARLAVKSSRAVFDALAAIAASPGPLGAAELARKLALPVSSAARALSTLEAAGYVERQGGARFVLGKSGQRLAYAFMAQFPIRDLALPYLQQLTLLSGCSSSLFVPLGRYAVRIALIAGTGPVVHVGAVGAARPLGTGAPSLALLAHHDSIAPELAPRCARIRAQGYATAPSALGNGGWDLAFPLLDRTGTAAAAIALEGLTVAEDALRPEIDRAVATLRPLREAVARPGVDVGSPYAHVDPDSIELEVS